MPLNLIEIKKKDSGILIEDSFGEAFGEAFSDIYSIRIIISY